ncbi:MAG: type II toxin-antitoxin system ParD family antitoxin [Marinicella sp.]
MTRTITVDTGPELRKFIEGLVESGNYKTNSEVIREGLRLLKERHAKSKLETLRKLIDEGENSGESINWNLDRFLSQNDT